MLLVNINLYINFGAKEAPFAIVQSSLIENRIWPDTVYGLKTGGEKSYIQNLLSNVAILRGI
jgi:hypothetical protein